MMYGEGRKAPPLLFWPGGSEASRFGAWLPGLRPRAQVLAGGGSTPEPWVTFGRPKVTKRRWGDPRPPLFA